MADEPTAAIDSHHGTCHFTHEERTQLRILSQRDEFARFPKWTTPLAIALFAALFANGAALWVGLSVLRERIATVEAKTPDAYPPQWFQDKVEKMSDTLDANNRLLIQLSVEVSSLKAAHNKE